MLRPTGTHTPLPDDVRERNAILQEKIIEHRMAIENDAMERELAGEDGLRVEFAGAPLPTRMQVAGHKHKLSDHAGNQMGAVKRMGGAPPKWDGKALKDLTDYDVKWKNRFALSEMGGIYPRIPDASRIAIASASLDGYAAYEWSQKPEPEKALLLTWEGYMQWCRTLVADPVNTLADLTLRIKECQ